MAGAVASAFSLLCERFYTCGVPNTRKREEALVEAYFAIYDMSSTARNKGTRAGGAGCCWSGGGLGMYGISDYQGG